VGYRFVSGGKKNGAVLLDTDQTDLNDASAMCIPVLASDVWYLHLI